MWSFEQYFKKLLPIWPGRTGCFHYFSVAYFFPVATIMTIFPPFFIKMAAQCPNMVNLLFLSYRHKFVHFELQTQICTFWANFKFQIRKHYYFCWYQQFYGGFTKLESILSVFACFLLLFSNFCCTLSTLCSVTLLVTEENVWYLHNFQIISSYVSHFCPNYMVRYFSYVY